MRKTDSFWDASALVPLCVHQAASLFGQAVLSAKSLTVWWSTPVEMLGAIRRLHRDGKVTQQEFQTAIRRLAELREGWAEVPPTERVRERAEALTLRHALRTGDALQLAAALVWARDQPLHRAFVCFDHRLGAAANKEGFQVVSL